MPLTINPALSLAVPQTPLSAVELLQPGTVVTAQVQKLLAENLVRIAIASLSLDVATEVPLQAGQTLQLAVAQTASGLRLQIVPTQGNAAAQLQTGDFAPRAASVAVTGDTGSQQSAVTSTANSDVIVRAQLPETAQSPILTRPETLAVSVATQSAAAKQASLSPLFANLSVAVSSAALPRDIKQAASQLLALQVPTDVAIAPADLKAAVARSGIFLEASLAQDIGKTSSPPLAPGATPQTENRPPDLKAALLVLRETLSALVDKSAVQGPKGDQSVANAPSIAGRAPDKNPLQQISAFLEAAGVDADAVTLGAKATTANSAATFETVIASFPKGVQDAIRTLLAQTQSQSLSPATLGTETNVAPKATAPAVADVPPPFRGGTPVAQPATPPALAQGAPVEIVAQRLLTDTDAALARQTLLQVASLPDRIDQASPRNDIGGPRWNFEIPFATPQGTAMAQFEISRDGGGQGESGQASQRIWRARFSISLEPAGPIHALVSLSGDKTSVRMWAERPETAALLKADAPRLNEALRRAELEPGDIVIAAGEAPKTAPPRAGHFLDRAT